MLCCIDDILVYPLSAPKIEIYRIARKEFFETYAPELI
jgi:hypothetical protein